MTGGCSGINRARMSRMLLGEDLGWKEVKTVIINKKISLLHFFSIWDCVWYGQVFCGGDVVIVSKNITQMPAEFLNVRYRVAVTYCTNSAKKFIWMPVISLITSFVFQQVRVEGNVLYVSNNEFINTILICCIYKSCVCKDFTFTPAG